MAVFEKPGILRYINAHDTYSIYGGSRIAPETLDAMCAVARYFDALLFISGHGPQTADGKPLPVGKAGSDNIKEQGYEAARQCGINILAAIREHIGNLDRIDKVIKVFGLVACAPDFYEQPYVMHGFSDLMVEVLGDRALHARSAMGTSNLLNNIPAEIELIVKIKD